MTMVRSTPARPINQEMNFIDRIRGKVQEIMGLPQLDQMRGGKSAAELAATVDVHLRFLNVVAQRAQEQRVAPQYIRPLGHNEREMSNIYRETLNQFVPLLFN